MSIVLGTKKSTTAPPLTERAFQTQVIALARLLGWLLFTLNCLAKKIDNLAVQTALFGLRQCNQRGVKIRRQAKDHRYDFFNHGISIHHLDTTSLLWYYNDTDIVAYKGGEVPLMLCECGCGRETRLVTRANRRLGEVNGQPRRFIAGHNTRLPNRRGTLFERLDKYVTIAEDGCWHWTGAKTSAGYGHINIGAGKYRMAHALMYERFIGRVPAGCELDHLCRNRGCVNPWHLEPVTHRENVRRGNSAVSSCTHPESEKYRRKSNGRIVYCAACRREQRRETSKKAKEKREIRPCRLCGSPISSSSRSDCLYCSPLCRSRARVR